MIWFILWALADGVSVGSGSMMIIESGEVGKYWKEKGNWGGWFERFWFVEGVHEDNREFLVWNEDGKVRNIRVRVEESSVEAEVVPNTINFESFYKSRLTIFYTCGYKKFDYLKILFICEDSEGLESTYTIQYLKICDNQEGFIWNFSILNVFGIFIIIFALWLERPSTDTVISSENSGQIDPKFSNSLIGYIQSSSMIFILFILLATDQKNFFIEGLLNILSGISLAYITKNYLPMLDTNKALMTSWLLGLALVLFCTFIPNILTLNLQFIILSLFALKSTKFWSFPLLISATLLVFIYNMFTINSNVLPNLSDTTLLHVIDQTYPGVSALPATFSKPNLFFFILSLPEVYFPGAFLIKFRSLSLPLDNKYFTLSFYCYIFSCLLESTIRGFTNASCLFLPGPFIIVVVAIYSVYRQEFKSIFFTYREQNLVSGEVAMKPF